MAGGGSGFQRFYASRRSVCRSRKSAAFRAVGQGKLAQMATQNIGEIYLALPKGFQHKVIGKVGGVMTNRRNTPRFHDATTTFRVKGDLRIVRNHKIYDQKRSFMRHYYRFHFQFEVGQMKLQNLRDIYRQM